ncbi:cell wall biosynthesis protein, partial [Aureobasidium melanogenum]|uniref:Cell wall biosynthesis protein n=2 Tax=Aureobasidium melanogenum TaxID=46634 RepID=A0A074VU77_AURM1
MRCHILTALAALAATAVADVKFTSPVAGQQIAGGTAVTFTWTDDGTAPTIDQFATYTLNIIAGGNTEATTSAVTIKAGAAYSGTTGSVTYTIPLTLGKTAANGYFLQMISVGVDGGTDIVYSSRFGLTGMTGTFSAAVQQGVTAAGSDTTFTPEASHELVTGGDAATATSVVPEAGVYTVPYRLQTGLIKYAPMQPMPGTKITAKTPSMLNPTSAFTIFSTYAPPASITLTVTESNTVSVSSRENPAAAATQPTAADMKKYLNRWKD